MSKHMKSGSLGGAVVAVASGAVAAFALSEEAERGFWGLVFLLFVSFMVAAGIAGASVLTGAFTLMLEEEIGTRPWARYLVSQPLGILAVFLAAVFFAEVFAKTGPGIAFSFFLWLGILLGVLLLFGDGFPAVVHCLGISSAGWIFVLGAQEMWERLTYAFGAFDVRRGALARPAIVLTAFCMSVAWLWIMNRRGRIEDNARRRRQREDKTWQQVEEERQRVETRLREIRQWQHMILGADTGLAHYEWQSM